MSLFRSTALVSSMTLLSRIVGLLREVVFAAVFGAMAGFDAFLVAFKIPNFLRRLFAEGAFAQAFVPVLSSYRENHTHAEAMIFMQNMAGMLGGALFLVIIIAELLSPVVVTIFAPGFVGDDGRFEMANDMLHITFPYILLISMTAFYGSILNSYNHFSVPAFTPVLLNLALISAAMFLSPLFATPVYGLAWGVFIAGVLQLCFQFPFLRKRGLLVQPKLSWRDPGVRRVLKLMVPAIFGVSVAQISVLIDTLFASFLPVGSISWLYYADRLTYFPLGVIGVALATVVLPHLSRHHASNDREQYAKALNWSIRMVLLTGIPAGLGILILAEPLLATLFQYGKFRPEDVVMAGKGLQAYALGVPAFMLIKVLASGFYSKHNIKTPAKIAAVAVIVNVIFNFILIEPLAHAGLALATSLAAMVNAGLLLYLILKSDDFISQSGWVKFSAQLIMANVLMLVILSFAPAGSEWSLWPWYQRILQLLGWILFGAVGYLVGLSIFGFKSFKNIYSVV